MKIKSYSFPSSHAYAGVLGAGYLASVALGHGAVVLGAAVSMVAILIGVSRVRIGAHYPSDVIAGWLLGLAVLLTTFGLQ